jgi:heme o synthase
MATARDLLGLTKPRVIPLLLVVALATMWLATSAPRPWTIIVVTLVGGTLAVAGAQALNAFIDRDIDRKMKRTRQRPLAARRLLPRTALIFGVLLAAVSFGLMLLAVNTISALLTLGAVGFYVLVYSRLLKLRTAQNIVIGGAAGAAPALIGWAAVTNELSFTSVLLFAIVFLWTPPHFWALALVLREDYKHAGVPMLPVVQGQQAAARQILGYTLVLIPVTLWLIPVASLGWVYGTTATVLGGILIALELRLLRTMSIANARAIFVYSMLYLALVFGAMMLDRGLGIG